MISEFFSLPLHILRWLWFSLSPSKTTAVTFLNGPHTSEKCNYLYDQDIVTFDQFFLISNIFSILANAWKKVSREQILKDFKRFKFFSIFLSKPCTEQGNYKSTKIYFRKLRKYKNL